MTSFHPKTSGAAVGAALGIIIVGVLQSISGIHLAPELNAAIPSFLSILIAWLVPSSSATSPPTAPPVVAAATTPPPASSAAPDPPAGGAPPPQEAVTDVIH